MIIQSTSIFPIGERATSGSRAYELSKSSSNLERKREREKNLNRGIWLSTTDNRWRDLVGIISLT